MPRYGGVSLVRCRSCGHVYTGQEPTPAELEAYYSDYPRQGELHPMTAVRFGELLGRLERFRQIGRLLDVGAGDAHFLRAAQTRGWETHGTEYAPSKVQEAHGAGLRMHEAPWRPEDAEGSFDVVSALEVVEHLVDPLDELRWMARLVRPGGAVVLTTPNFSALSRRVLGPRWRAIAYPEHLSLFTARTLHMAAERAGLRRLELSTTGLSTGEPPRNDRITAMVGDAPVGLEERFRNHMYQSHALRTAVAAANRALSAVRLGETIKALYVRP
jgi:2-polyprenyl-3-methyl-5-hydroxy-6-metoxy-1,4-benzoquinol methylase